MGGIVRGACTAAIAERVLVVGAFERDDQRGAVGVLELRSGVEAVGPVDARAALVEADRRDAVLGDDGGVVVSDTVVRSEASKSQVDCSFPCFGVPSGICLAP